MLRQSILLRQIIFSFAWFLRILSWGIIINSLLSWVLNPMHPVKAFISQLVEPIVAPFRRITTKLNTSGLPIDFSPLLAYIVISIVASYLHGLI